MSPEKIGECNTETSEVKDDTSEVLMNKERIAENDVQKWANETNLDTENTTEALSENEKLAKSLLKDPQFSELTDDEKKEIYKKALGLIEEYEMMGFPIALDELKKEFEKDDTRVETVSFQDEFQTFIADLDNPENPANKLSKREQVTLLKEKFGDKIDQSIVNMWDNYLAVSDFADKSIKGNEKTIIQNAIKNVDLSSVASFQSAMYAVYEDESISEETREKLIQVSGVVNVPKIDIKTVSNLSDDLENRNKAREDQYDKLKDSEKAIKKELAKKKKELEEIPESERTEEQVAELEELEEQLKTVKKQKEYFDESNRNVVTRRPLGIGGTAEMSQKSLFKPVRTIIELNGIRLPLDPSSSEKQNLGITCLHSYNQMENGSGKQRPMHLGKLVFDEIRNGKALKESQYDKTDVISNAMGFENGEIITKEQLRQEEIVLHAFRNPDSPSSKEGAKQDLRELGLLKEGENKMSYEGVIKMAEMIEHIRNLDKLPTGFKSKYDYLKDKYGKKERGKKNFVKKY